LSGRKKKKRAPLQNPRRGKTPQRTTLSEEKPHFCAKGEKSKKDSFFPHKRKKPEKKKGGDPATSIPSINSTKEKSTFPKKDTGKAQFSSFCHEREKS